MAEERNALTDVDMQPGMPDPIEIFGSYMSWKIDADTWVISFMQGSQYMYLLEGEEKALLLDTGWGAPNLREYVENLTNLPVIVANTHYHPDHAAGNSFWPEVYVHRYWRRDSLTVQPGMGPFDPTAGPYPDYHRAHLHDRDVIELGGRNITALLAKDAHCNSSVFFLDRDHKMLFCGDEFEAGQVNLFDNSNNPNLVYDVKERLKNFRDNAVRLKTLSDSGAYRLLLPNHNGTPISCSYLDDFIELVDRIYEGTAKIEDELHHKYIEHDPQAPFLCRVRCNKASIFIRRDELMKVYGKH